MKLSDTVFNSCAELAALIEPVSPAMAVLQLSSGRPKGRLRVYGLGNFRVSVLETSQTLFLSGQRRSDRLTLAFELGRTCDLSKLRAQGAAMPWPWHRGALGAQLAEIAGASKLKSQRQPIAAPLAAEKQRLRGLQNRDAKISEPINPQASFGSAGAELQHRHRR